MQSHSCVLQCVAVCCSVLLWSLLACFGVPQVRQMCLDVIGLFCRSFLMYIRLFWHIWCTAGTLWARTTSTLPPWAAPWIGTPFDFDKTQNSIKTVLSKHTYNTNAKYLLKIHPQHRLNTDGKTHLEHRKRALNTDTLKTDKKHYTRM